MGYYLSQKNSRILSPYLKLLESLSKSISFNSASPLKLKGLLQAAFNISHPHLKEKFILKVKKGSVFCEYIEMQLELEIANIISDNVDIIRVGDDILNGRIPVRYLNARLSNEELETLKTLDSKTSIIYNQQFLEITYATGKAQRIHRQLSE